jgi:hypothetical protein
MSLATLVLTVGVLVPSPGDARPFAALFAVPSITLEAPPPPATNGDYQDLDLASWIYVSTAAADWSVTAACGGDSSRCSNKHYGGLFLWELKHEAASVPLGLAIDAGILLAVRELVAPEYPRLARLLLYGLSAARVVVLSHKVSQLRRDDRR